MLGVSDEWHHCTTPLAEGVAFVHIELYLRKAHTQKPLVMLGESILNKITILHGGTWVARTRRVCVLVVRIIGFCVTSDSWILLTQYNL